jgi:hypothetical protein
MSMIAGERNGSVSSGRSKVLDRPAAGAEQADEAFAQPIGGGIVDHRTHERRGIVERRADDEPVGHGFHLRDQIVVQRCLDDQPPGGRAMLAGAGEGRLHDQRGGIGQLGRVPGDHGVVAAHFQRQDACRAAPPACG